MQTPLIPPIDFVVGLRRPKPANPLNTLHVSVSTPGKPVDYDLNHRTLEPFVDQPPSVSGFVANQQRAKLIAKFLKFWPILEAVASMSKDPSTKVGAIALDDNFNIVATGFNGFPRGVNDDPARYLDRETKYRLVAHAEQNLIAQAAYGGRSLKGATLLVSSLFPCSSCAKSIIQSGIVRVISPEPDTSERWAEESKWGKILFDETSVEQIYVKQAERSDGSGVWEVIGSLPKRD